MRKSFFAALLVQAALPAQAQETANLDLLAEAAAMETAAAACSGQGVYPDLAVIEDAEERVWTEVSARIGEPKAVEVLSSEAVSAAVRSRSADVLSQMIAESGGPDRLCERAAAGEIVGLTTRSLEQQEADDAPDALPERPQDSIESEQPLPDLVPLF